jgi:acetyltransferase-like isoleucine patch superfamily enzyme
MKTFFSVLIQLLGALLPSAAKCALFRRTLGWAIGANTRIGLSLILCERVRIGSGVRVGHLNWFGALRELQINDATVIGNLNHFSASRHSGWPDSFWIGSSAKITSRHVFDCSGGIGIGNFSLIGGRDTQCWTHYYDSNSVHPRPLSIGERCYVCARATLVYCRIPSDCVVGAGAVVTGDFSKEGPWLLLAGNPAIVKKKFEILEVNR